MATATAEPPPTPAPAVVPIPAAPTPQTPNAATIPTSADPPKPGSAREKMMQAAKAKYGEPEPTPAPKPAEGARPGDSTPKPADAPEPKAGEEPEPVPPPPDVDPKDKKQNPWKLYRQEKERAAQLERQIAEAKTSSLAESERARYIEDQQKLEAKLKTYEDEIRFKSYEKSEEFATKYEQPYNDAWQRHMQDLRGVTITGEDGVARPMQASDILDLVNLELPDARNLADEKWGKFASDAMQARKEIRNLFEAKNKALDDAKKTGAEREKQTRERATKWQQDTTKFIAEKWTGFKQAALKDPKIGEFLNPADGDDTRNQLLGKGFALVEKAFAVNPMDAKLTPQQREEAIRDHARVYNRAAAYGPMRYVITKLQSEIAALKKSNGEFKKSTPPTGGGGGPQGGAPATTSARDAMRRAGERYSK